MSLVSLKRTQTRLDAQVFAVTAILVLAFALLVVASNEVEAKRLAARKASPFSSVARPELRQALVDCKPLPTVISGYHPCSEGATVTHDVTIVGPNGHLVVNGYSLEFQEAYTLSVQSGGALTLSNNVRVTRQPSYQDYQIIAYRGSTVEINGADVSGAERFYVEADGATLHNINYHDNGQGLELAGEGITVDGDGVGSQFYNNVDAGVKIIGHKRNPVTIRNSVFSGGQQAGVLLKDAHNNVIDGSSSPQNEFYGNEVGILLDYSGGNEIKNNYIHGNTVAGVKNFVQHPMEILDNQLMPLPNTLNGNTITGNGDGVIDYTVGMVIDSAQAQLISGNQRYGLASIDTDAHQDVEASIGSGNGLGKAASLRSMRGGGIIYGGAMPTNTVYVTYCEEDIPDCTHYTGSRNDARSYDDYAQAYTTTRRIGDPGYFTSTLMADEEHTFQGNHGMWTPRFLAYYYRLATSTRNYACDENVNGGDCVARAVTLFDGQDHGSTRTNIQPSPQFEYVFITMRANGDKEEKASIQTKTTPVVQPAKKGRRPAMRVAGVPEIRGVSRLPA